MSLPPFDRVVDEHGPTVLRVCRAVLPAADAEDAAADAFLAALRAYPQLRPDSDIRAWLVTIAHRKSIDVLRRASRRPVASAGLDVGRDDPDPVDGDLWSAVRALPEKQREAVTYRYLADLAYAQIGAAMGISEAAARRNAADGIKTLRRQIGNPEGVLR